MNERNTAERPSLKLILGTLIMMVVYCLIETVLFGHDEVLTPTSSLPAESGYMTVSVFLSGIFLALCISIIVPILNYYGVGKTLTLFSQNTKSDHGL